MTNSPKRVSEGRVGNTQMLRNAKMLMNPQIEKKILSDTQIDFAAKIRVLAEIE